MTLAKKHSKYNVPQQFVEMVLLQNKPWLVRYRRIRAMSSFPSVECGKFKSKLDGSLPANAVNDRRIANAVTLKSISCLP